MTATAARPSPVSGSASRALPQEEMATALASAYLRYVCACWRGDVAAPIFGIRLGAYWRPDLPPAPDADPDATSPHGGAGRGIRWYRQGDEVRGYIPGARGGYAVPVTAIPRLVLCAPACPCEAPAPGRSENGSDCAWRAVRV